MKTRVNEIIMENHDYLLELIKTFDLDMGEAYGELAVRLCEMANSMDLSEPGINRKIREGLRRVCTRMSEKKAVEEVEVVLCPEIRATLSNPEQVIDRIFAESVFKSLPDELQNIINMCCAGYPVSYIAREIGRSSTYVNDRLRDCRNAFRHSYRQLPMGVREWYLLVGRM